MRDEIVVKIKSVCEELYSLDVDIELDRPDEKFGDFSCNIALKLASDLKESPRSIAEKIAENLRRTGEFKEISIAGPGFINIFLTDSQLIDTVSNSTKVQKTLEGKTIVAEYSDPNPFKVLHAGHLYTSVVGDCIANMFAAAGGEVHRVNFGGDVGMHVAKAMWGIIQKLDGEHPEKLDAISALDRPDWMADAYVAGNNAYEDDLNFKQDITAINKRVYELHDIDDHSSPFAQIYWTCRQWSYDYFDKFYAQIGSGFEKYYPESKTAPLGLAAVKENLGSVYEKSQDAVVFKAEKYGLHTRVFINSQGLPTYETKEVGLSLAKWRDYQPDQSLIITGNDIDQYMKVVIKSIEQFKPELARITRHITHGNVKLSGGVKMSSRKGNVLRAIDILEAAKDASEQIGKSNNDQIFLGAIKFSFLKTSIGGDIIYNPQESVSLEGKSGPYLQYALVRAKSILAKSTVDKSDVNNLEINERPLARKISEYPEIFEQSLADLSPHHICNYLYELAQEFNRFYEKNRVIGDDRETIRINLINKYADVLSSAFSILGIKTPEKM